MSMICAISNQIPEEPVVSPISGCVFEKRLIKKYISNYGEDPVAKEPLTEEQLIEIKQFKEIIEPKLPGVMSIPQLLKQIADEWDAEMLSRFENTKMRIELRKEMSQLMYRLDASERVISRLLRENEQLREKLKQQNELVTEDT